MMRIGEVARAAGVNPKTIRYYESIGVLPEPARTGSGYRDCDKSFPDRLTFIRTAQRLGVTLDEIREILSFRERGETPCTYVRGVLDAPLTEIASEADRLPPAAANDICQLIEHVRQKTDAAPKGLPTSQPFGGRP